MIERNACVLAFVSVAFLLAMPACAQTEKEETLVGPDSHEIGKGPHDHLLGDWGGRRSQLEELGVVLDLQYISDSLWNIKSDKPERLAMWNRVRGTVDIDFSKLSPCNGLYFHATAVWQGGGNLGTLGNDHQSERYVQRQHLSARLLVA